jgi:N-acetylmuramoyl-L-alanine amidase
MRFSTSQLAAIFVALSLTAHADRLSPLAARPDWKSLDEFQETITREEFTRLLDTVYAPGNAGAGIVTIQPDAAVVKTSLSPAAEWRLRFAPAAEAAKQPPRYWRSAAELGPAPKDRPLEGVKIALDAGHLGGAWAKMEERWFQVGDSRPVVEGEMTLRVAQLLAPKLRALGAEVSFVREGAGPVTSDRPETLDAVARGELAAQGVANPRATYDPALIDDPLRGQTVQWESELLFYRISEIRRRAALVNDKLKPDLVLCIHFNAEGWGADPLNPEFVPRNHLHVLINGNYSAAELRFEDQRHDLLAKLLNRSFREELEASGRVADALAAATKLPPYQYTTPNARRIGPNPYVWARNLLANRLYLAPVVFLEPYVMNNGDVWARVQAGDYEGERLVNGVRRKSIYREYADAVAAGLADYFANARTK